MNFVLRRAKQERISCADTEQIRCKEWMALFTACQVQMMGISLKSNGVVSIIHFTEKCMEDVGSRSGHGCFEFIIVMY